MTHAFEIQSNWLGDLTGTGQVRSQSFELEYSVPRELKGAGVGTNPEELLLASSSTCYLITLAALLARHHIDARLRVQSEITVDKEKLRIEAIHHRPTVILSKSQDAMKDAVMAAIKKAEAYCMVACALRITTTVTADIQFTEE